MSAVQPVRHAHATGIDIGGATPDGSDTTREFPAHTPGLRDLVAWLRQCGAGESHWTSARR